MDIKTYTEFLAVTFIFILFILRAVYYLAIAKSDPLKAVIPKLKIFRGWDSIKHKKGIEKTINSEMLENS